MVALVIRVIDLRVQQFHDEGDAVFFREGDHGGDALGAVFDALGVGDSVPVTGETDHLFDAEISGGGDEFFINLV